MATAHTGVRPTRWRWIAAIWSLGRSLCTRKTPLGFEEHQVTDEHRLAALGLAAQQAPRSRELPLLVTHHKGRVELDTVLRTLIDHAPQKE